MSYDPKSPPRPTSPDFPIDSVVASAIDAIRGRSRGFVLGLSPILNGPVSITEPGPATDDGSETTRVATFNPVGTQVEVVESRPTADDWIPPANRRSHVLDDPASLLDFALRLGDAERSVVFYDDEGATIVIDDQISEGGREFASMRWRKHPDFEAWEKIIGKTITHRELLKFLITRANTVVDTGTIVAMRTVRASATVSIDSDLREEGTSVGVMMTTNKGSELAKFPKSFRISVPVLFDSQVTRPMVVALEVIMPETANQPVTFLLASPDMLRAMREETEKAFDEPAKRLRDAEFIVLRGRPKYQPVPMGYKRTEWTDDVSE